MNQSLTNATATDATSTQKPGPLATLSPEERSEVALALLLLKDFRCNGKWDPNISIRILELALKLGVSAELEQWMPKLPPMKVIPR